MKGATRDTAKVSTDIQSENQHEASLSSDKGNLQINDQVLVYGKHLGRIQFFGNVHYTKGQLVGVHLDEAVGKNDGTVKGTTYFNCPPLHGLMVRECDVCKL